jgi:peptide/nickel transport system ATP-binding protein
MVARTFLLKPRIIVADEPVSMVDASLRATILESLLKMNQELGVSLVYITHDLTTAYQLGGNIMILYRGAVVEIGDIELVTKDPKHPYTRLLVSSIPQPNPKLRANREKLRSPVEDLSSGTNHGCTFVDRCPVRMPKCRESPPPLFRTEDRRAAACFLHEERPVISSDEVVRVLA